MRCRETNPMADIYRCLAFTHTPRQFARFPFVHANSVKRGVGRFASPSSHVTLNGGSLLIFEITLRQ